MTVLLLLALGCADPAGTLTAPDADLKTWPLSPLSADWTVAASDEGGLTVLDVGLDGDALSVDAPDGPVELGPGESLALAVTYAPLELGEHSATLTVQTSAGDLTAPIDAEAIWPAYLQAGAEMAPGDGEDAWTFEDTLGVDDFAFGGLGVVWTLAGGPPEGLALSVDDPELLEGELDDLSGWEEDPETETWSQEIFLQPETGDAGDFAVGIALVDPATGPVVNATIQWAVQ